MPTLMMTGFDRQQPAPPGPSGKQRPGRRSLCGVVSTGRVQPLGPVRHPERRSIPGPAEWADKTLDAIVVSAVDAGATGTRWTAPTAWTWASTA
jgi:hypothetical protein